MATTIRKEKDPLRLGVVGTIVLAVVLILGFTYESIPFIGGSSDYHAQFADASGLSVGSEVQIGGVPIGEVHSIELDGDKVDVEFGADTGDIRLSEDTTAAIKVETVLGARFIELANGHSSAELERGATIPVENTASGYDITRSLEEVTERVQKTDTVDLSGALDQVSAVEQQLPENLKDQLVGVQRLSDTVAGRDAELREMLAHASGVTGVLADRSDQIAALMNQGSTLFAALNERSSSIHRILVQSRVIADELTILSRENRETLGPTLTNLDTLVQTLNNNYANIDASLTGLQRYVRQMGDVVGSGPFFGVLLHNILPANLSGQLPGSLGGPR
ncbi:MCE family protein [Rhodococcoides kyotonense]|uniref:Mammalian cell entry protein n=1 Tax=Rhodococcoides kyotonense TaxID=398843 RepID=A0A177YMF8_9NOCA|nr:MCE family protein [Rhodococcus kyotonensis]OAK56218.1 mammalian cell entry protein [Rhodococcus kyotonensis]